MSGLSDPTRVLDAITATVDELCACGCGLSVAAAASPSAWFATPGCQRRWYAARADRPMRDGRRMAGIGPGWGSDQAGPEGGSTHLVAEAGEVGEGGWLVMPLRALPLPPGWRVEVDTSPILAGEAPWVTLTAEQHADAVEMARRLRSAVEDVARALVAGLGPVLAEARITLANGHRALIDLGLIEEPPASEREATLRAVRSRRNSGPPGPARAPRRIDPRGGAPRR